MIYAMDTTIHTFSLEVSVYNMDKRVEAIEFTICHEPLDDRFSKSLAIPIPTKRNVTRHNLVPQCRKLINEKMNRSFSAPVIDLASILL